jgi:alpha-glucosidase
MDFIPNHTSDKHEWFVKSCESDSPNNPYRDYYVWYSSEDKTNPPNNWVCENVNNFLKVYFLYFFL